MYCLFYSDLSPVEECVRPFLDHLLSIPADITGPKVPSDSPPPTIPDEFKDLDITGTPENTLPTADSVSASDTSSFTGNIPFTSDSFSGFAADFMKTFPRSGGSYFTDAVLPTEYRSISLTNTPVHKRS